MKVGVKMELESGIYIRVDKEDVLLENMTEEERNIMLNDLTKDGLIRTINRLCEVLKGNG